MYRVGPLTRLQILFVSLLVAVSVIGAAGVHYHEAGQLDVDLTVTSITDPAGIGRGTTMTLQVTNRELSSIRPVFNVIHSAYHTRFYYHVRDGPAELSPGATANYTIEAPTVSAAPPREATLLVTANDAGTQQRVQSRPTVFTAARQLPVTNPEFAYWSYRTDEPVRQPVGWDRTTADRGTERVHVDPAGRAGATLRVENVSPRPGPWAMAGLQQRIRLPRAVTVSATPHFVLSRAHASPPAAVGLEIADGDRRVWIVFANVSDRTRVERTPGDLGYAIVAVPARPGERTAATVNVSRVYERMGWRHDPRSVNLLVFAAAYPDGHRPPVSATFHRVNGTGRDGDAPATRADDGRGSPADSADVLHNG